MTRRGKAVNITDAVMSIEDERRIRTTRYIVMMSIRIVLVILCGVLVMLDAPFLVVWLPLCAISMAVLPWLAVLLANDRLAKEKPSRFDKHQRRARPIEAPEHRMIDSELWTSSRRCSRVVNLQPRRCSRVVNLLSVARLTDLASS